MKVFLSYAAQDGELARKIAEGLRRRGFHVWWDDDILPGDNWAEAVSNALKDSQAMVVLLTPNALRSKWVQRDIEFALVSPGFRQRLIPVVVGDAQQQQAAEASLPWILRRLAWVRLPDPAAVEDKLAEISQTLTHPVEFAAVPAGATP